MDTKDKFENLMRSAGKEIKNSFSEDLQMKREHIANALATAEKNKKSLGMFSVREFLNNSHFRLAVPVLAIAVLAIVLIPNQKVNLPTVKNEIALSEINDLVEDFNEVDDLEIAETYFGEDLVLAHQEFAEDFLAFEQESVSFINNNLELDEDEGYL